MDNSQTYGYKKMRKNRKKGEYVITVYFVESLVVFKV